jgi:Apea-like HEPN
MTSSPPVGDLYVGLSGLVIGEAAIEFPGGVRLEKTFAHVMSPILLAFAPAPPDGSPHPPPWKTTRGGFERDITAQLTIPASVGNNADARLEVAMVTVFLLRLWSDPSIIAVALSNLPFAQIAHAADEAAHIMPLEYRPRSFALGLTDESKTFDSLNWVVAHFPAALNLVKESAEFRLAYSAMNAGQFIQDTALILISLWGALEVIFSPSTSELRFRVSALIASYLNPPGSKRIAHQRQIADLYDKRSAAAHGKRKHAGSDVLLTFELLRKVLIAIIREGKVPTKIELEERLFGLS